jgi:hypothetical protein
LHSFLPSLQVEKMLEKMSQGMRQFVGKQPMEQQFPAYRGKFYGYSDSNVAESEQLTLKEARDNHPLGQ